MSASVYPCARLCVCVCVCVCSSVFVCERGVREKSLSQCMTLSNRLGIKLTTTKTFPALKPIYTPIQASLMSALKSTTNSPWRKSLAHRGCSGCLSPCVCVRMCAHAGAACVYVWICVRMRVRSPSVFSFMMTNHFLTFVFSRLYTSHPFHVHLLRRLRCRLCFGVRCFNKLSHI